MSTTAYATAATSALSLFLLSILVLHLYRDYRVDLFRNRMFALRDSLFDFAAEGQIAFDHPAYGLHRTMLNGFIRFGERLSLSYAITGWWASRKHAEPGEIFKKRLAEAMHELTPKQARRVNEIMFQASIITLEQ